MEQNFCSESNAGLMMQWGRKNSGSGQVSKKKKRSGLGWVSKKLGVSPRFQIFGTSVIKIMASF